ncbi:PfkB family carbohydrate kinase, partial [Klebsiella pneumoniae]
LVDTTGAGDLYAAGFLYGYTNGLSLLDSGKLGSFAAGLIIQQIGPRANKDLRYEAQQAGLL